MSRARIQTFTGATPKTLTLASTLYQIVATSQYVKSCVIQAAVANTGIVSICDATGKTIVELQSGKAATIQGDALDGGNGAMFDVSQFYAQSTVGGDIVLLSTQDGI